MKAFYGLKHALRAWYNKVDKCFYDLKFEINKSEHTLYMKKIEK